MKRLAVFLVLATACAHKPQFRDQPVVWRVADDRNIDEPKEKEFLRKSYFGDIFAMRRLTRALELRTKRPAQNTNALDEVPDSTWFTNRVGVRTVSPQEAAKGAHGKGPPHLPLTVVRGKTGGGNPGFVAKDARGVTYLIKFDTKENPEQQTAADIVVGRIFHSIGYNVPSDNVFWFSKEDVRVSPKATLRDEMLRKRAMTQADLDEVLDTSPRTKSGVIRALASEYLSGVPKGGVHPEGVRKDDANDRIAHEHRRELRGLRVFAAWLGHTDMKEDNTIDMYVEEDGRKFLRHYLLDFGEALGGHQSEKSRYEDGYEHFWDWEMQGKALLALGLWTRPWEAQKQTPWRSIGAFSDEHFDPRTWRGAYPYWPFMESDASDAYWAAKLIARFDRPILTAIVAASKLSEPEAAAYLVDTLLARRKKILRAYLEDVTPLDELRITSQALYAVDLSVREGLAKPGIVQVLDVDGHVVLQLRESSTGQVRIPIDGGENYQRLTLRVRRGHRRPAMQVHLIGGKRPRILGVIRAK